MKFFKIHILLMSFDVIPLKKHVKLLVKLSYNKDEKTQLLPSKVTSLLSQQGIGEAHLIDDFLEKFFSKIFINFNWRKKHIDFKIPIVINIHKKKIKTDVFIFNPTFVMLFKRFLDCRRRKDINKLFWYGSFNLIEIFKINIIKCICYNNSLLSFFIFKKFFIYLSGLIYSLKYRREMKRRKINFRRKIKRDAAGNISN